jgi:hypothetical protein
VPIVLDDPRHPVSQAIKAFAERQVATQAGAGGSDILPELRTDRRGVLRRKAKTP